MDIASGRAMCQVLSGRTACMEELRKAACRVGAHAMYGFSEAVRADYNYVSATFGLHDAIVTHRPIRDAPVKTQAAAAAEGSEPACDPICSPGFVCREGECLPQCNPPCESGEVCSRKRVCEHGAGRGFAGARRRPRHRKGPAAQRRRRRQPRATQPAQRTGAAAERAAGGRGGSARRNLVHGAGE